MTGVVDLLLRLVAGATPPSTTPEATNVLRFPDAAPSGVHSGVLAHTQGGLTSDASLRPRVSVLLGPGATFQGVASTLLPLYATAAAAGGPPPPTLEELARALVVYSRFYLPVTTWAEHRVGLRLPVPIEIEQPSGIWILNADTVRADAGAFEGSWTRQLTRPPTMLLPPDPLVQLPGAADDLVQAHPTAADLGAQLMAMVLTNPSAGVLLLFEVLRRPTPPGQAIDVVLAALDGMVAHQAALLASTSAGQAVLRRLDAVLADAPGGTDPVRLQRGRDLLAGALFLTAGGRRVPLRELPETAGQLTPRGPVANSLVAEPPGGSHRLVLGHDLTVGVVGSDRLAPNYIGPAYRGRFPPAPFIVADADRLPQDPASQARLRVVTGIASNEGFLDAIRMRDAGILSSGIQQWSAHAARELPALLFRFKTLAPEEFSLYFGMCGLDVRPDPVSTHIGQFILHKVDTDGSATPMNYAATRTFFDGIVDASGHVTFGTGWACRFRLAAVTSELYRRCQVLEAIGRFDRIKRDVGSIAVSGSAVPVETLITSEYGAALLLDSHINKPNGVRPVLQVAASGPNPADPDQREERIVKKFHDTRSVAARNDRNRNIDNAGFATSHDTFAGW